MEELLTAAQMRAAEEAAIESGEVTGLELMERAGRGVIEAIFAEWPELERPRPVQRVTDRGTRPPDPLAYLEKDEGDAQRAIVLCGPGNNGGDGFVVARLLAERNWAVEVYLYGDTAKLPPDARANYERWAKMGEVRDLLEQPPSFSDFDNPSLWIDALFGTGLTRPIRRDLCEIIDGIGVDLSPLVSAPPGYIVAIDTPTGLNSDTGAVLMEPRPPEPGTVILASSDVEHCTLPSRTSRPLHTDLTVTFHRPKLGHYLGDGPSRCGKLVVVDIGLGPIPWHPDVARLVRAPNPYVWDKGCAERGSAHKFDHGHALVVSGPMGRSGAARLAARGALRVGAGVVTVAAPGSAMMECACQLTAIMLRRYDDAAGLEGLLEDARINVICLGPGLGLEKAKALAPVALASGRAVVLDADALTAFADAPEELFGQLHDNVVLTPHHGELARLFPDLADRLAEPGTHGPAYSKLDATRDAAARARATILYKGADTVIAGPDGHASIHAAMYDRAAPWLATAGSGDVLAGLIAGLLARGHRAKMAAETAVWLHVEAARRIGPGLIAEDLAETLPMVLAELEN